MADPGFALSKRAAKRTAEVVTRELGRKEPRGKQSSPQGRPGQRYYGKLASDLDPGSMSAPSPCQFNVWLPDPADTAVPPGWIIATDESLLDFTAYSLDPSMTGVAGYFGKIEWEFGIWTFYWVGCAT